MSDKYFKTGIFVKDDIEEKRRQAGTSSMLIDLGEALRTLRKDAGLSRVALASRCDTSPDQLGRFEHGIGSIGFASLKKRCATLGVDAVELVARCSGRPIEAIRQSFQMADNWKGKPMSLEDIVG